jgi:hypothetical protein
MEPTKEGPCLVRIDGEIWSKRDGILQGVRRIVWPGQVDVKESLSNLRGRQSQAERALKKAFTMNTGLRLEKGSNSEHDRAVHEVFMELILLYRK